MLRATMMRTAESPQPATEEGLKRKLIPRQIAMMAMGSAIGVGLFLGSTVTIRLAGPGVIVTYLFGALVALVMGYALAEAALEGGHEVTLISGPAALPPPSAARLVRIVTSDELYALSAYILFLNKIVGEDEVMDANSLPRVKMPNRDNFVVWDQDKIEYDPIRMGAPR